ncbi:uncharacterized protein LOC127136771 [Lathyrus oleraceus]|uniref:uncharacterized protein LOC127136771 n=1 Tax=Pisum sativum TaxID=3888 RepID=UPI0021D1AF9F|nr:uncharacterized protein LOC127136771 [Pisum sativum]
MEDEEKSKTGVELLKDIQMEDKKPRNFVAKRFDYSHVNNKDHVFQHRARHAHHRRKGYKKYDKRRHHYGKYRHIRPNCYKLYGFPQHHTHTRFKRNEEKVQGKKVWKPKVKGTSLISHTSLRVSSREDYYFDSGCSKHMTRERAYLEELQPYSNNYVSFGNGAKDRIKEIENLVYSGLPSLDNVLLVEDREQRRKMDPKSEEGIFLSYSTNSRAYIVYNKCSKVMMEFINMVINDTLEDKKQEDDEFPPQQTDVPVDDPSKDSDIVPEITYSNDL